MSGLKMAKRASSNLLFLCFLSCLLACFQPGRALAKQLYGGGSINNIKGMYVFGSSLVDNGNNNFIQETLAKANYLPYGLDFPLGSSGRFTNGKNVVDLLGNKLQLPDYLPVFKDPSTMGKRIFHGVNYASGGSGILDNTGSIAGRVISLNEQIDNFEQVTLPELERQVGNNESKEILAGSLFVVGSGGNDYTLNYFLTGLDTNITLQAFTWNLISTLSFQLQISLVDFITPQLPGSTFVYVNSYKIIMDIIINPSAKGFSDTRNPCCEVPSISEGGNGISCKRGGTTCEDRSVYVYFDGLHPTEALNAVLAAKAFSSNLISEVYPFNVEHLARS